MSTERTPQSDKELWQSLAADRNVASTVTDMDFAAWLEGRLPEAAAARVDAAVASDPEMRRAALELADVLAKPLPMPPARMAVRARALVGFEVERRSNRNWLSVLLPSFSGGFSLQRGAMVGAAIVLAISGFMMGGGLGESYAHEKHASTNSAAGLLGTDTTNELNDLFTSGI